MTSAGRRPLLRDGGTIAVVAPSSHVPPEGLAAAEAHLAALGYTVKAAWRAGQRERFMSAPDAERAAALMDAFLDPAVDAIFLARGGYGSGRILDLLDYTRIAACPKPCVGFSDGTALQLALLSKARLVSYSGTSVFPEFRDGAPDPLIARTLWPLLRGEGIEIPCTNVLRGGQAEGPLVGGCLSLVVSLLGTDYFPDLSGAILLLEDVNEEPFRIDRMLTQLRHAGVFKEVAGVVFGVFSGCAPKDAADGALAEVLAEAATWTPAPVIEGIPYGHIPARCVLPIGETVRVDTSHRERALTVRGCCNLCVSDP